jgi:predicted nuclease with TOPRIM domain
VPDNPSNGTKRFEELAHDVRDMRGQLTSHGESLSRIEALMSPLPTKVEQLRRDVDRLEDHASISVAKVTGLASTIAAVVAALGLWLVSRGGS